LNNDYPESPAREDKNQAVVTGDDRMSTTFPKELSLEKLKAVASIWVEKHAGYIAEISFFCSNETSFLNLKELQYCIDFVLCDPPRIEPVSHFSPRIEPVGSQRIEPVSPFSSDFIAKEIPLLSVYLLEAMPDPTVAEKVRERLNSRPNGWGTTQKERDFLHQWRIDVRWETDQPNTTYIPESKQILYLRSKKQPTQNLIKFSHEDYDYLKQLPYFTIGECIGLMLGMPYDPAVIAIKKGTLDIQTASAIHQKIKKYIELLSRSIVDGELQLREGSLDSLDLVVNDPTIKAENFLEWARNKDYQIPRELGSSTAEEIVKKAKAFQFKKDDVIQYEANNGLSMEKSKKQDNLSAKKSLSLFPCVPGTKWEDITITLISYDQVKIKTPSGEERYSYAEIGMASKKNTETKKRIWKVFMLFAIKNRIIDIDTIQKVEHTFQGSGKQDPYQIFITATKELNKHLKDLFGIEDSIYVGHYKKAFKDEASLKRHFPKILKDTDSDDEIRKNKRQKLIDDLLKKKGYATKIKFKSSLQNKVPQNT